MAAPIPEDNLNAFRECIRTDTMTRYLERNGWAEATPTNGSSRGLALSVCEWLLNKPQSDPRITRPLEHWEKGIIRFVAREIDAKAQEWNFELPRWMRERIDTAMQETNDHATL